MYCVIQVIDTGFFNKGMSWVWEIPSGWRQLYKGRRSYFGFRESTYLYPHGRLVPQELWILKCVDAQTLSTSTPALGVVKVYHERSVSCPQLFSCVLGTDSLLKAMHLQHRSIAFQVMQHGCWLDL